MTTNNTKVNSFLVRCHQCLRYCTAECPYATPCTLRQCPAFKLQREKSREQKGLFERLSTWNTFTVKFANASRDIGVSIGSMAAKPAKAHTILQLSGAGFALNAGMIHKRGQEMNDTVPIYRLNIWPCLGVIVMVLLWVIVFWVGLVFTSCTRPLFHNVPAFRIDSAKTPTQNKIAWQQNRKERSRRKDWVDWNNLSITKSLTSITKTVAKLYIQWLSAILLQIVFAILLVFLLQRNQLQMGRTILLDIFPRQII